MNDLLSAFGRVLVERFAALNLSTAVLLAAAFVLDRALARRARASWRIALYAPVALRILLPLDWSLHVMSAPGTAAFFAPLWQLGASPATEVHALSSGYFVAAIAYVAIAIALAARAVVARVRFGRALATARPATTPFPSVPTPVVEHADLGPMAFGLFAPRIVLPSRLLTPDHEHALACVLRHETAHLRRRDAWLSAAMQLLAIAAWPVLPMWIAIARVRQLVEIACDEAALDGADATERRRYGHALLDISEWQSRMVTSLDAGELHFGSTLRARIEALTTQRRWPLAAQALVLSAMPLALFAACSASTPATSGSNTEGYGYAFETDSQKAANAEPAPSSSAADTRGRLPPEQIQAVVRAHFGAFRGCYEAGLARDPKLGGIVSVRFVIGADGATREAADESSSLPDKAVVACIVGEFGKLTYPKPQGGDVTVVYPIQFAP